MYSNLPNLTMGFHGCDKLTFENVLYDHETLKGNHNSYDWAVISLGHFLDLTDYGSSDILKNGYKILKYELSLIVHSLPIKKILQEIMISY